ncbi:hypothetical protein [Streptomyces abyssalis]|nr:hypothetical protein [Streptomyces abyssalis]
MIYTLARGGGLRDDQIRVQGIEDLGSEVFEIVCPIRGIEVQDPIRIGSVTIASESAVELTSIPDPEGFASEFRGFQAYAVAYVTDRLMLSAEKVGIQEIDLCLSWLTVRSRYSVPPLPDGTLHSWDRASMFVSPSRGRFVYLRGLSTHRRWLRIPKQEVNLGNLELAQKHAGLTKPSLFRAAPMNIRQAIVSCARAAKGIDDLDRVLALWEAIEFYVGDTSVPRLFSKSEMKAIRKAMPKLDNDEKSSRLGILLGDLNSPPLIVKFRRRVAIDGAPVSQSDVDLFVKLRKIRNDAVHGRSLSEPESSEVSQAVAVLSRILVFRMHALGQQNE